MSVITITLRQFLSAVYMQTAYDGFEDTLNPVVQECMQQEFPSSVSTAQPSTPTPDPATICILEQSLKTLDNTVSVFEGHLSLGGDNQVRRLLHETKQERHEAEKQLHLALGIEHWRTKLEQKGYNLYQVTKLNTGQRNMLASEIECPFLKELLEPVKQRIRSAASRQPEWIQKCREGLGQSMVHFVREGESWDTYCLVHIMNWHYETVFAPRMRSSGQEKDIFRALLQVRTYCVISHLAGTLCSPFNYGTSAPTWTTRVSRKCCTP